MATKGQKCFATFSSYTASPSIPRSSVGRSLASSPIRTSRQTVSGVTNSKSDGEEEEATNGTKRRDRANSYFLNAVSAAAASVSPTPLQVPKSRLRMTFSSLSNLTGRRGGHKKETEEERRGDDLQKSKSMETVLFSRITE